MKQWIIDRYNKGQIEYKYLYNTPMGYCFESIGYNPGNKHYASLYDFLFNPKWGFAKAFWGTHEVGYADNEGYENWMLHIQQMVIADDPLKYLDQFKD